jgi:hypothetical protein
MTDEQFELFMEYVQAINADVTRMNDYLLLLFFVISITCGFFIGRSLGSRK